MPRQGSNSTDNIDLPISRRRDGKSGKAPSVMRGFKIATLVIVLAAAAVLVTRSVTLADYADGYRTEKAATLQEAVRVWRRAAWQQDDFFSQVHLGDLYSQNQSFQPAEPTKNTGYIDPVEAYVWYYMALRPYRHVGAEENRAAAKALYNIRVSALKSVEQLYQSMTFEQRLEARARIIYILSSRGADGFLVLGRIHATGYIPDDSDTGSTSSSSSGPYIRICVRSSWSRWYSSWLWWLWSSATAKEYPHPPVWKWLANTTSNWNKQLPDYMCQGSEVPPPPTGNSYPSDSSYSNGGPIVLNNNGSGDVSQSLPPPIVTIDQSDSTLPDSSTSEGDQVPLVMSGGDSGSSDYAPSYSLGLGSGSSSYFGPLRISSVFSRNDAEGLTYFLIAASKGNPLAASYVSALRNAIRYANTDSARIIADAEKRAKYWMPPFEYYPGITPGGLVHSDESLPSLEQRIALGRVDEIPFPAVRDALAFRGLLKRRGCGPPPACFKLAVTAFQKALDYEPTGFLIPPQTVRLIQMTAVDGYAESQYRLAIMYAKGIGVVQNYPRAERWFIKAANQQHADALYSLYLLYMTGPNGIEQNKDKANSAYLRAAKVGRDFRNRSELPDLQVMIDNAGQDRPDGAKR